MKKFVIIFGPQAVGKMTVGQELMKKTKLKLFHNHMTIDLVSNFFSYGTKEGRRLVNLFRKEIFEEVSKSELPGMIFTYVWAFNEPSDWDYINELYALFHKNDFEVYFVELETDLQTRLERNKTPNRLNCKTTKRDITWTENEIIETAKEYRLNSNEGEIKYDNYIKINTTNLTAEETSKKIISSFNF